jgi:hypothetical protein
MALGEGKATMELLRSFAQERKCPSGEYKGQFCAPHRLAKKAASSRLFHNSCPRESFV